LKKNKIATHMDLWKWSNLNYSKVLNY
jgi:hypothetical protein